MFVEHPCRDISEIVGYVSLSSGDSLRTGVKNLEVTWIFKARRPTETEQKPRLSSRAIQFLWVRKRRGNRQWDFWGGASGEKENQGSTLLPFWLE